MYCLQRLFLIDEKLTPVLYPSSVSNKSNNPWHLFRKQSPSIRAQHKDPTILGDFYQRQEEEKSKRFVRVSSGPLNRKPVQLHPICPRLMMLIQATLLHAKIVKDAVYYSWWSISRRIARHRRLFIEREFPPRENGRGEGADSRGDFEGDWNAERGCRAIGSRRCPSCLEFKRVRLELGGDVYD